MKKAKQSGEQQNETTPTTESTSRLVELDGPPPGKRRVNAWWSTQQRLADVEARVKKLEKGAA
jgi:hypothetical protein